MGRPRKAGKRNERGRLIQARDYGNAFVQARRALFDANCIKAGKAADQVFDGIGQLWALDFLDGHHLDPELMRDTARKYAALYWARNGATAPKTGQPERASFGKPSLEDRGSDFLFEKWIDFLPTYERSVLERVTVNQWFGDGNERFVERLVGVELVNRHRISFAPPEQRGDRQLLGALLRALFVLVDGTMPIGFRRAA